MQKVKQSLSPEDQEKFENAVINASIEYFKENPGSVIAAGAAALLSNDDKFENAITRNVSKDFMMRFDGKTGKKIIKEFGVPNGDSKK